ncbi:proteoglycan 4-like [Penaeus monodon]|uniref:proteoglycan 4-like n=1 Tax=Penaeus monodon TaxID=6687 RepID=UPI0018A6FD47|nr:proteoglycan 4-like [Penaeus monodon]
MLKNLGFTPVLPPDMKAKLTLVFKRLDRHVVNEPESAIADEIMAAQTNEDPPDLPTTPVTTPKPDASVRPKEPKQPPADPPMEVRQTFPDPSPQTPPREVRHTSPDPPPPSPVAFLLGKSRVLLNSAAGENPSQIQNYEFYPLAYSQLLKQQTRIFVSEEPSDTAPDKGAPPVEAMSAPEDFSLCDVLCTGSSPSPARQHLHYKIMKGTVWPLMT